MTKMAHQVGLFDITDSIVDFAIKWRERILLRRYPRVGGCYVAAVLVRPRQFFLECSYRKLEWLEVQNCIAASHFF